MDAPPFDLCVYHARCYDGACAAWVARRRYPDIELCPVTYGTKPPSVTGRRVLVLDFCYPRDVMVQLRAAAQALVVLDHHKTARDACGDLPFCTFDMERSGAGMAWDYCFPNMDRPWLVNYVEDRDLWRNRLHDTEAVSAFIQCIGYDPTTWDSKLGGVFAGMWQVPEWITLQGKGALAYRTAAAEAMSSLATMGLIGGHSVPVVMAPVAWSDVSDVLCKRFPDAPFAATYRPDESKPHQYTYGLASRNGFDVSAVAKSYGGGGHKAAAGFLSERLTHIPLPRLARADNWPLCPGCGEDELYDLSTPPLATNTLRCYRCGWAGTIQKEKTHV